MPDQHFQGLITLVERHRSRFLYGLGKTPDDRLNWTSGEAGTTPLQIAAKVVEGFGFVTHQLKTGEFPDPKDFQPEPFTTREAAYESLARAYDGFLDFLRGLKEEDL